MLMDEPFSALDALTRGTLQDEVRRICQETGQTVFMITHDVDEAIYLADRIVLMTNGPGAVLAEIVENPLPQGPRAHRGAQASAVLSGAQPHHRFPGDAAPRASSRRDARQLRPAQRRRWCGRAPAPTPCRRRSRTWCGSPPRALSDADGQTAPRTPLTLPLVGRVGAAKRGGRGGVNSARECSPTPNPLPARGGERTADAAPISTQFTRITPPSRENHHETRRPHREAARHQAREGLDLEAHLRADRRHVAGDDHRRAARQPQADQAAGRRRRQAVRPHQGRAGDAQRGAECAARAPRCRRPTR